MTLDADKRLAFEAVFDKGRALIIINITDPKVDLPEIARSRSPDGRHLPLNYSRTFVEANIKVKDEGIYANLAFGGPNTRYLTFVPWSAVMAILQKGVVLESWPDRIIPNDMGEQILVETVGADDPADPLAMTAEEMKWFTSKDAAEA